MHNTGTKKGANKYHCCRGESVTGAAQAVHLGSQTPKPLSLGTACSQPLFPWVADMAQKRPFLAQFMGIWGTF